MYFLSLVIIPKCPVGEVENSVRKTLERNYFDSNGQHSLDKPVYTKALVTCDCQDKRGDDYARKEAEEKVGSFSWLKECFFQECPGSSPMEFFRDPRFLKWWKTYREALEEFFSRGMEGVSCPRCQNKDRLYMEVDLRSSLEWFTVGHRWHGVIKGKKQFYRQFAPPLVISYRHLWEGTLETLVLGTTAIKRDNYKEFIRDNIADPLEVPQELVPVVVVTPDGSWHMESQYSTRQEWEGKVEYICNKYGNKGYWAVVCAMKD